MFNGNNTSATTTITDEADPSIDDTVILSIGGPATVVEGQVTTDYTVALTDENGNTVVATEDIAVDITYTGTASDGSDYIGEAQVIVPAGSSNVTFNLSTLDDAYSGG